MSDASKPISDSKAIAGFFGRRPGDTLADFMEEYKALTLEDKKQLGDGIRDGSLTY